MKELPWIALFLLLGLGLYFMVSSGTGTYRYVKQCEHQGGVVVRGVSGFVCVQPMPLRLSP